MKNLAGDRDLAKLLLWLSLCGCLMFSLISISLVEIFLGLALLAWIIRLIQRKDRLLLPSFLWPLAAYAALSLLSSAFSVDLPSSVRDCRGLLLFLAVPLAIAAFTTISWATMGFLSLLLSAAVSCAYSLYQFGRGALPENRIMGFMGHYMTQAGLLMLFCLAALSFLIFLKGKIRWLWLAALAPALACLALTLTRSAWIGLAVGACLLLGLYRPKLLVLVPVAVGLFFLAAPKPLRERALSTFSLKAESNQDRIEYLRAGWEVIRLRPWLGTGPDTVDEVFNDPSLRLSAHAARNVHLHNNLLQIAAERGIPAAAAWLAFMVLAFLSALKIFRRGEPWLKAWAGASLAALAGLFTAGFFEYNFGDSEITVLFLLLLAIPHGLAEGFRAGRQTPEAKSE
ncbi:MAG TPA: O-antigen ligase family protein [Acidobacteriota bacterium]